MLIRFTVENYRSFRDRVSLDLSASSDKLLPNNYFASEDGKLKVLKTASIYGSNASGKTTIFGALMLMQNFLMRDNTPRTNQKFNYTPFAFDNNTDPTAFEAEFIHDGIRHVYGFSYNADAIVEEHLYVYPKNRKKTIFERNGNDCVFKTELRLRNNVAKTIDSKKLFAVSASQLNDADCRRVVDWFSDGLIVMVNYNIDASLEILFDEMQKDESFKDHVLKALKIADFGISELADNPLAINIANSSIPLKLHNYTACHTFNGKDTVIPLMSESAGTIRFMSVIGPVIDSLTNGYTVVVDEMDLSFHTDLTKWIVGLFHDPEENTRNAQLIYNTHDAELLDQSSIRRDQVWIAKKDYESGMSTLDNLRNYRLRNDLDLRKAFLNGSLGGSPFIESEKLI